MFAFDDSLKNREIEVEKITTGTPSYPKMTMPSLIEINKDLRYKYSKHSLQKLSTVHKDLAWIFCKAANFFDIRIVSGYRTPEQQHDLYLLGRSTKDGYKKKSRHQSGLAVDAVPVPKGINMYQKGFENSLRWAYFVGFIKALGAEEGVHIKSGWKWRTDPQESLVRPMAQNTFPDANHFEKVI
jgi:peptidoglycan L-alanyl-D-glutamate endopeptidase CwlK